MNPLKKLAGQTAIYGMGTIIPRLLNYLLLTPFYTRIFVQGEYGIVTELYAYVAFLMVLLTYGMETAYFRYAESEKSPENEREMPMRIGGLDARAGVLPQALTIKRKEMSAPIMSRQNTSHFFLR